MKTLLCSSAVLGALLLAAAPAQAEDFYEYVVCKVGTTDSCEKVKAAKEAVAQRKEIGDEIIKMAKEQNPNLPRGALTNAVIPMVAGSLSLALAEKLAHAKIPKDCTGPAMSMMSNFINIKAPPPKELLNYGYYAVVNGLAYVATVDRHNCDMTKASLAMGYPLDKGQAEFYVQHCAKPKDVAKLSEFTNYANGLVAKAMGECHG